MVKTYFLKNSINDLIKIGKSSDPERRVAEVRGQLTFVELSIIHVIEGDYESYLHGVYAASRKSGEWFDIKDFSIDSVNKIVSDYQQIKKSDEKNTILPEDKEVTFSSSFLDKVGDSPFFYCLYLTLWHLGCAQEFVKEILKFEEQVVQIEIRDSTTTMIVKSGDFFQKSENNDIAEDVIRIVALGASKKIRLELINERSIK